MSKDNLFDFLPKCTATDPQGTIARLKVSQLKPTQNAVGMDEIHAKVKKIEKKSTSKLQDYLLQRTVPIIIGNDGKFYLIDHHHLATSIWLACGDIDLPVEVVRNWNPIKSMRFWKAMVRSNWVYPFAADGGGPQNPESLKKHIKDLDNDIYRSLSWVVRQEFGYVKSPDNAIFAEFKWGSFFRTRVLFDELLKCKKNCGAITLKDIEKSLARPFMFNGNQYDDIEFM